MIIQYSEYFDTQRGEEQSMAHDTAHFILLQCSYLSLLGLLRSAVVFSESKN